jgi:hypothetical protein
VAASVGISVAASVGGSVIAVVGSKVGADVAAGPQAANKRAKTSIAPIKVGYFILSHSFQTNEIDQLYK